jgi:lysozyme
VTGTYDEETEHHLPDTALHGPRKRGLNGLSSWGAIAGAGNAFAVTKATDGDNKVDPKFAANWSAIRAAGLVRGAYHYYRTQASPEAQANRYCDAIGELGAMDLPPILDLEEPPQWAAIPDPSERADLVARWIDAAQTRLGRTPLLYVGVSFWNDVFAGTDRFKSSPLWIANYATASQPRLPDGWSDWAFWQYSNKGSSPGVHGDVDLDFFNGTITGLLDLAGVGNV